MSTLRTRIVEASTEAATLIGANALRRRWSFWPASSTAVLSIRASGSDDWVDLPAGAGIMDLDSTNAVEIKADASVEVHLVEVVL